MYNVSSTFNRLDFIGRVGKVETGFTKSKGTPYCRISLASHQQKPLGDGKYEQRTTWLVVLIFGTNAEFWGPRLGVADIVHASGIVETRSFLRKDGSPGSNLEMMTDNIRRVYTAPKKKEPVTQEELDLIPPAEVAPETFEIKPEEVQPGFTIQ